jgi:hypothetical protein
MGAKVSHCGVWLVSWICVYVDFGIACCGIVEPKRRVWLTPRIRICQPNFPLPTPPHPHPLQPNPSLRHQIKS